MAKHRGQRQRGNAKLSAGRCRSRSLLTDVHSPPGASANCVLHARGSYRITPNWYLEGFLSANNTYDYQQRIAGFLLRYKAHPHPAGDSAAPTSLFDVEGVRPLHIP
jgi:hypothetical protein